MSSLSHLPVSPLALPESFNFATSIVDHWATSHPTDSQIALYWTNQSLSNTVKLTYTDISRQSHRIAHLLTSSLSLTPGQLAVVILPRVPEWWSLATACLRSGIILCPCTTLLVDKDIEYRLQISNAAVFFGDAASVAKCLKVKSRGGAPHLRHIVQINSQYTGSDHGTDFSVPPGVQDFQRLLSRIPQDQKHVAAESLGPKSPALTFFTSGTTGPPKIVLHTQTSYPLAHATTGASWLRLRPDGESIYWNLSEQGWAKAAWSWFGCWTNGATLFIHDDRLAFNPRRTLEVLHKFPVSVLCAPPTVYRQLVLNEVRKLFEGELRPLKLRHACGAGEPLNESVIRTWKSMTRNLNGVGEEGMEICDGYGQTETILICANQAGQKVKPGSMGRPLPGVPLRVIDADGGECKNGEEGDMAVEIDPPKAGGGREGGFFGIFEGYVKNMETLQLDRRIKETKSGKRYYITGDRAYRDEDGYFWFVGRNDDVINSAGYRIGPFEVESVLKMHDAVVESAVVAAPDPEREEVVKAFIVLGQEKRNSIKGNDEAQKKLVKELQDFCKQNAAPYKYPRKVEFVDASFLPKTISGKIKRADLKRLERERYEQGKKARL